MSHLFRQALRQCICPTTPLLVAVVKAQKIDTEYLCARLIVEDSEWNPEFRGPAFGVPGRGSLPISLPFDLSCSTASHCIGLRADCIDRELRYLTVVMIGIDLYGDVIVLVECRIPLSLLRMYVRRLRIAALEGKVERLVVG